MVIICLRPSPGRAGRVGRRLSARRPGQPRRHWGETGRAFSGEKGLRAGGSRRANGGFAVGRFRGMAYGARVFLYAMAVGGGGTAPQASAGPEQLSPRACGRRPDGPRHVWRGACPGARAGKRGRIAGGLRQHQHRARTSRRGARPEGRRCRDRGAYARAAMRRTCPRGDERNARESIL